MKRFLWSAGILFALIIIVVLAFTLSPWPSVAVIRFMFSRGDQASEAALEKHVPAGIVTRRDIAYGDGRDEISTCTTPKKRTIRNQPSSGCMVGDSSPAARVALGTT
jgi:hypothetical protein